MSSSNRLDPKTLPSDTWKQWHRDSFRMWKRIGFFWQAGFIVLMAGAAALGAQVVEAQPVAALGVVPLMMALGFAMIPVQMRVLGRARRGEDPDPLADLALGLNEALANPGWWLRGTGIALIWMVGIMLAITLMSLGGTPQEPVTPKRVTTSMDLGAAIITYGTLYLWALKPRGFLGMDYFLEIREGLGRQTAKHLETLAGGRNAALMFFASASLAAGAIGAISVMGVLHSMPAMSWIALVVFPLLTWHAAGMTLCAWHDIFDPDGGLAERQKVLSLQPAHVLSA